MRPFRAPILCTLPQAVGLGYVDIGPLGRSDYAQALHLWAGISCPFGAEDQSTFLESERALLIYEAMADSRDKLTTPTEQSISWVRSFSCPAGCSVPIRRAFSADGAKPICAPGEDEATPYRQDAPNALGTVSFGLTLYQAFSMLPLASTRKDERRIPMYFLPYMDFSVQTP